jgi:YVTN family beta-propeller protein
MVIKMALQYERNRKDLLEPYIGPRPFGLNKQDQERFFGRDGETEDIISLIYSHQLVLIYAPSGAGKTSIFNGQIIPELEKQGFEIFPITRVGISSTIKTPDEYFENTKNEYANKSNIYIFNAMQSILSKYPPRQKINIQSNENTTLSKFLEKYYAPKENTKQKITPQLLIFDQFEELFNYYPENWQEQQKNLFEQITEALNTNHLLRIVIIIREDYIAQLDPFREILPEKLRPRYRLERLSENAAMLAIKKPLEKVVTASELNEYTGIIHEIVGDLLKIRGQKFGKNTGKTEDIKGSFIEPIYLQVVCQRWWREGISQKKNLTKIQSNSQELSDVDKALEDFYEDAIHEAIAKQTDVSEEKIREFCETELITSNETRGIVYQGEDSTEGIPNTLIEILNSKYLLRREIRAGGIWYELTHDRLIKPIKDSNKKWRYEREREREKDLAEVKAKIKRWYYNFKIIIPIIIACIIVGSTIGYIIISHPQGIPLSYPKTDNCIAGSIVNTGKSPVSITRDPKTNTLYVANRDTNTISVIECNKIAEISKPIVSTINVGHYPLAIDVNPNTHMVYVDNSNDNTVSVIDGKNNSVTSYIQAGNSPYAVAVNPQTNMIYVANDGDNTVTVIDGKNNSVVKTVKVGRNPEAVAVNPQTNMIYVANYRDNTISVIDGKNNSVVKTVYVGRNPEGVAVNPQTNMIYVANNNNLDNSISVIDGKNNSVVKTVKVGMYPEGVAVNPQTNMIYVANNGDNTISVIDGKNNSVVKTVKVGGSPTFLSISSNTNIVYVPLYNIRDVAVISGIVNAVIDDKHMENAPIAVGINQNTNMVYVVNQASNIISVFNGSISNKTIFVGGSPYAVAVNPQTNMVYVANNGDNTTSVIDGKNNSVVETVKVGGHPGAVAVNPQTNMVYVANYRDNTVSVIDGKNNSVVETVNVGGAPYDVAVNQNTSMAYVSNMDYGTISRIN